MEVVVGVSNRHVHLNKFDLEILFGKGYELKNVKSLVQPLQFVSNSFVTIKSDSNKLINVRVIGPIRDYTQVEISKTDAIKLKINPPIRDSGDIIDSEKIEIIGPMGSVLKPHGCIIANRHIHMTKDERKALGLLNVSEVKIKIGGAKGALLDHVFIKENTLSQLELHIDTDDANANLVKTGDVVTIIKEEK